MRRYYTTTIPFLLFAILLWSCNKETSNTPSVPHLTGHHYDQDIIAVGVHGTSQISWSSNNVWTFTTSTGTKSSGPVVTLGQVIFYDKITGLTNVNCANCHVANPNLAAIEPNVMPNGQVDVNTVSGSARMQGRLVAHPAAGLEDGDKLVAKMSHISYYPPLFKDAFGTPDVTAERISEALAQFMAVMPKDGAANDPRFADPFK